MNNTLMRRMTRTRGAAGAEEETAALEAEALAALALTREAWDSRGPADRRDAVVIVLADRGNVDMPTAAEWARAQPDAGLLAALGLKLRSLRPRDAEDARDHDDVPAEGASAWPWLLAAGVIAVAVVAAKRSAQGSARRD